METFRCKIECPDCGGTGLYVGLAERDGSAVICHTCKGTGCYEKTFNYSLFTKKKVRKDVKRVYKSSFGYIHTVEDIKVEGELQEFSKAGVDYESWLTGAAPRPLKTLYCPLLWTHQEWHSPIHCKDGSAGMYIPNCPHKFEMEKCWKLFETDMLKK